MIRTFNQAVKYLEGFIPTPDKKHPGSLGLRRMQLLMDLLGNPQNAYPTIHVGGTSGKGSTATIIASILATKYKVGLHTSPHLVKINERIKITDNRQQITDNKDLRKGNRQKAKVSSDISDKHFIELVNKIRPVISKMEKSQYGKPSYFEIVTAMAFLYFKQQKADMAVIEVGMGGKFDATNVIKPLVAVLTNVGLDHTEVLGETVEEIAQDKAGIIKPGIGVVTGVRQPSVIKIIEAIGNRQSFDYAQDKKTEVSILNRDFSYEVKKINEEGSVFDYKGDRLLKDLKLKLLGRHQVENAALSIRTIELLSESAEVSLLFWRPKKFRTEFFRRRAQKASLPADSSYFIRKGLKEAFIPGRLEIVQKHPTVILDGAHNPQKMRALVTAIKDIFPKSRVTAIIAIKSGKDARGMLKEILSIASRIIFTKFHLMTDLGDTFSYEPAQLLKIVKEMKIPRLPFDFVQGKRSGSVRLTKNSLNFSSLTDIILVTGSLYLVGEIKKILKSQFPIYNEITMIQ